MKKQTQTKKKQQKNGKHKQKQKKNLCNNDICIGEELRQIVRYEKQACVRRY